MTSSATNTTGWSTSSHGEAPEPSPAELSELEKHLDECSELRGSLFRLQCLAEAANGTIAKQIFAIVLVVAFFVVIGYLTANA